MRSSNLSNQSYQTNSFCTQSTSADTQRIAANQANVTATGLLAVGLLILLSSLAVGNNLYKKYRSTLIAQRKQALEKLWETTGDV